MLLLTCLLSSSRPPRTFPLALRCSSLPLRFCEKMKPRGASNWRPTHRQSVKCVFLNLLLLSTTTALTASPALILLRRRTQPLAVETVMSLMPPLLFVVPALLTATFQRLTLMRKGETKAKNSNCRRQPLLKAHLR